MRKFALALALSAAAMPVTALAGTKDFAQQGYALPANKPVTVVLMRPDVNVGELQAGGLAEPNADWTNQARANLEKALAAELAGRKVQFASMETKLADETKRLADLEASCGKAKEAREAALKAQEEAAAKAAAAPVAEPVGTAPAVPVAPIVVDAPPIPAECASLASRTDYEKKMAEYNALHTAVINSILAHQYNMGGGKLPTKKDKFAYSLGAGTSDLGKVAGANYGLFVMTNDQFSSASRKAMQVAGFLGCFIGVCAIVGGGIHVGYVSMVELETGNIVWFNLLRGSKGDIREEEGAKGLAAAILSGMPARPGEMTTSSAKKK